MAASLAVSSASRRARMAFGSLAVCLVASSKNRVQSIAHNTLRDRSAALRRVAAAFLYPLDAIANAIQFTDFDVRIHWTAAELHPHSSPGTCRLETCSGKTHTI